MKKKVLMLVGGWEGHRPEAFADYAEKNLLQDYDVTRATSPDVFTPENLATFDVVLPIWTFGEINEVQEKALISAVADGLGYVGWHGNASSFLKSRAHKFLLGGAFVEHPGGEGTTYTVNMCANDPLVDGIKDFTVTSEQYYLLVDPAVKVLATTKVDGAEKYWLKGVTMPQIWTRDWGRGRVFYCAPGHSEDTLKPVETVLKRALKWAERRAS